MKSVSVHCDFFRQIRKHSDEEIGRFFRALASDIDGSECPELPATLDMLREMVVEQNEREEKRVIARDTQEYRNWHANVLARDKYTCQLCGKRGGKIHAHHIKRYKSFPALRTEISNGITLCEQCHRNLHAREGY